jgi:hypothetical protein
MRKLIVALSVFAFALTSLSLTSDAAQKSAMGCAVGKQKWDASEGKCVDQPSKKPAKKSTKKSKKSTKSKKSKKSKESTQE